MTETLSEQLRLAAKRNYWAEPGDRDRYVEELTEAANTLDASTARIRVLEEALRVAEVAFNVYVQSHAEKRTAEGDVKAATNLVLAKAMRAALIP